MKEREREIEREIEGETYTQTRKKRGTRKQRENFSVERFFLHFAYNGILTHLEQLQSK